MIRSVVAIWALILPGCFSAAPNGAATNGGANCVMTISAAMGANNALQGLTAGVVSGNYSRSRTAIVCATLSQSVLIGVTGPSPKAGVTYAVSVDGADAGAAATAIVKYGESMTKSGGGSTHVTWRGTGGTVKIDAAAKDTLSFTLSGVTLEVDPDSSQNLATGTLTIAGAGTVSDLIGFVP